MTKRIVCCIPDADFERNLKQLCLAAPREHWFVWVQTEKQVYEYIQANRADLLVIHLRAPYSENAVLVQAVRRKHDTPIFAFIEGGGIQDHMYCLCLVEDGVILPMQTEKEFIARCLALLERDKRRRGANRIVKPGIVIDPDARELVINGGKVELTKIEFDLFHYMLQNIGIVLSRQQIYDNVWDTLVGYDIDGTVRCHIKTFRRKVRVFTKVNFIETVVGAGYRLRPDIWEQLEREVSTVALNG